MPIYKEVKSNLGGMSEITEDKDLKRQPAKPVVGLKKKLEEKDKAPDKQ